MSYLPKTWKATREQQVQQQRLAAAGGGGAAPVSASVGSHSASSVVAEVARNVSGLAHEVAADDLDVPTFLRRQASKA